LDDYLCVTVTSNPGEAADAFNKRLIGFWSGILRRYPDEYKRVYAETSRFAPAGDRLTRQYMFEAGVVGLLRSELTAARIEHHPIDEDDIYTKYEASPPEWFQIPH
jgi:hypothetical protein